VGGDGRRGREEIAESGGPLDSGERPDASGFRSIEVKIAVGAAALLAVAALAGRFALLPGIAAGGAIACGNFFLTRAILVKALSGEGTIQKVFAVLYALKFLGLAALVYAVIRSGRFEPIGFLLGFSSLVLGILLEGIIRTVKTR
jgi:hypothetical protein